MTMPSKTCFKQPSLQRIVVVTVEGGNLMQVESKAENSATYI